MEGKVIRAIIEKEIIGKLAEEEDEVLRDKLGNVSLRCHIIISPSSDKDKIRLST